MAGKFEVKAGQHIFKNGEKVVSPKTVLPTVPNNYSHKVDYQFEYTSPDGHKLDITEIGKEVFVLEKDTNKFLVKRKLNNPNEDTTLRFYTEYEKPFTSILFNSDEIIMSIPEDKFINEDKPMNTDEDSNI